MENPTIDQLRLLRLCDQEKGPFVGEFEEFREAYGINRETLRRDYIVLLSQRLVRPLGSIAYASTYLPSNCLITARRKDILAEAERRIADWAPRKRFLDWSDTRTKSECYDTLTGSWPSLEGMNLDEVAELADVYLYWAQENMHQICVPKHELYEAAARGFARVGDLRRYAKAVKGYSGAKIEKGRYLDLAITGKELVQQFPAFADVALASLSSGLKEPYRDLTGQEMPTLTETNLDEFLRQFIRGAANVGRAYIFRVPTQNPLIGISNRIEDILGKAFDTSSKSLFLQTVNLLYIYVDLMESLVHIDESASAFEDRVGYGRCLGRARRVCLALEALGSLVELPEAQRKEAWQAALEIVRVVQRLVAVPIWNACEREPSDESRGLVWTLDLLGFPDKRALAKLLPLFERLQELASQALPNRPETPSGIALLFDLNTVQAELSEFRKTLARIDQNTSHIVVQLAEFDELLASLLALANLDAETLVEVSQLILNSQQLLRSIDAKLNKSIGDLRSDIQAWMESASSSSEFSEEQKQSFVKQLGEIAKLESAGEIVASIPLIPGFLEYKTKLGQKLDLNKWISKLVSLVKE